MELIADNVQYPGLWAEISCYIIAVLTGCQQRADNTHFEMVCLKVCPEKRVYQIKCVVLTKKGSASETEKLQITC